MRNYIILAILCTGLASCSDDAPALLTPDLVSDMKAYDLDNNGNASDIRVDFLVRNNLNVIEYRVMVLPASVSNSLDAGIAESLARESFESVFPESFEDKYSINRLSSDLLDANGALIGDGISYVVVVLTVGTGNLQLSEFSNPFTLKDQGIYNGDYEGFAAWKMIEYANAETGANCISILAMQASFTITLAGDKYSGTLICPDCLPDLIDQGEFSFTVADNTISNFLFEQEIVCYIRPACSSCVDGVDACLGTFTGQGIIIDEIGMHIFLAGDDCIASQERELTLRRLQ